MYLGKDVCLGPCGFSPAFFHCLCHYVAFEVVTVIARASSGFSLISPSICGFLCLDDGKTMNLIMPFSYFSPRENSDEHCIFFFFFSIFLCMYSRGQGHRAMFRLAYPRNMCPQWKASYRHNFGKLMLASANKYFSSFFSLAIIQINKKNVIL